MSDVLQCLEGLPPGTLYALIAVLAALENIFPPVPAVPSSRDHWGGG